MIILSPSLNFHEEKLWKIVELSPFLLGSKWMCKFCTKSGSVIKEDHVYLYECCFLFNGLKDLAYRDMVRENDGIGMLETWKLDMPQFWQNHHNKYLITGHKLLSGTKQLLTLLVQYSINVLTHFNSLCLLETLSIEMSSAKRYTLYRTSVG